MSYTTIAAAYADGILKPYKDFRNGWGGAPFIWDALAMKYNLGTNSLEAWPTLFQAVENNTITLEPYEWNALETTQPFRVVHHDNMPTIANSLEHFWRKNTHRFSTTRICHLPDQTLTIRELHTSKALFIAWNQTSVDSCWWSHFDPTTEETLPYNVLTETKHKIIQPLV